MKNMDSLRAALETDRTIDIVTVGAKTKLNRTTEIWFTNIERRIIICGTPAAVGKRGVYSPRDWLANLVANPTFQFCFKESLQASLPASATVLRDAADRRAIMTAGPTLWYREQGFSVEELVELAPIVDVKFTGEYAGLNA